MARIDNVQEAQRLLAAGLSRTEVAEHMGVPYGRVASWLSDPLLKKQKARRSRYSRPCVDCGKPTDGSGGRADQRERCQSCAWQQQHGQRKWTADRIVEWIKAYVEEHGSVPPATIQIQRGGPGTKCVNREFGTNGWRRAVSVAGFQPIIDMDHCGTGHALGVDHPLMQETARLYAEGLSMNQIAELHNVTQRAIAKRLKRLGVQSRGREEGRQLRVRAAATH